MCAGFMHQQGCEAGEELLVCNNELPLSVLNFTLCVAVLASNVGLGCTDWGCACVKQENVRLLARRDWDS